jgi:hypothetical protein
MGERGWRELAAGALLLLMTTMSITHGVAP